MSFKLIDKVKKNPNIPGKLKRVLEAYLSFANRDGTSIRPTMASVAKRVGLNRRQTISDNTQELVRLGILAHDLNEDGTWATFNYKKHGVWAYIYHANLAALDDVAVLAEWERNRLELNKRRSDAAKKSQQNRTNYHVAKTDKDGVAKTDTDQTLYTTTLRSVDTDPRCAHPETAPSAVSTAVSEEVSEEETLADARSRSDPRNLVRVISNHPHHVRIMDDGTEAQAILLYEDEATAQSQDFHWIKRQLPWIGLECPALHSDPPPPLVKPAWSPEALATEEWAFAQAQAEANYQEPPRYWSDRLSRRLDSEDVSTALEYQIQLFGKPDQLNPTHVVMMAEVLYDMQERYLRGKGGWIEDGTHPIRPFVHWNKTHKKGKLAIMGPAGLHKAWFSDSEKCARVQWEDHDENECPTCKRKVNAEPEPNHPCVLCGKQEARTNKKGGWCKQCTDGYDTAEVMLEAVGMSHDSTTGNGETVHIDRTQKTWWIGTADGRVKIAASSGTSLHDMCKALARYPEALAMARTYLGKEFDINEAE